MMKLSFSSTALCLLLLGCASNPGDRDLGGFVNDYFRDIVPHVPTPAEAEMTDRALCQADGARPETPEFAQCVATRGLARAQRRANQSTPTGGNDGASVQPAAGIDSRSGQACLGYYVQNPYGPPRFYCQ